MDHSDAVAQKIDALVQVGLCKCSELFLGFCIIQKHFRISDEDDVVVVVSHELDSFGFYIFSHVVARVSHATILGIVKFRICEDRFVSIQLVAACSAFPFCTWSEDGLDHSRVPVFEYVFVACCAVRIPDLSVLCEIALYHACSRDESRIVVWYPAFS